MEWRKAEFVLTDDSTQVDLAATHSLLADTYRGVRRPPAIIAEMVRHSLCFTLLCAGKQIDYGRAVTDANVFSWIADIVIAPEYRGRGLGKCMMGCIAEHPAIRNSQMVLQTRDAHGLYEKFGFRPTRH